MYFSIQLTAQRLTISWNSKPNGDAIEARKGNGVGFFSTNRDLLSVIFDDMSAEKDHQILEFKKYKIEASVQCGIVRYKVIQLST